MPYSQKSREELIKEITDLQNQLQLLRKKENKSVNKNEHNLPYAEELWKSFFSNSENQIIIINKEGTIISTNVIPEGGKEPEVIGMSAYDFIFPEYISEYKKTVEKFFLTGKPSTIEIAGYGTDYKTTKSTHWYHSLLTPVIIKNKTIAITIIVEDITTKKQTDELIAQSEERFRKLFEASFEAILIHDTGKIIDANQAAVKLFGYSKEELLKMKAHELSPPEVHDYIKKNIKIKYQETYETQGLKKDGTTFIGEVSAKNFSNKNKNLRVVAIRDISDRKKYIAQLEESKADYESLVAQSPDGIFIHDEHGKIIFANPSAHKIIGTKKLDQIKNKKIFDFVLPKYHKEIKKRGKQLEQGKDLPFMKMETIKMDGSIVTLEYKPVYVNYKGKKAVLVVYHDIDFQEQLTKEKTRATIAEQTNKALKKEIADRKKVEEELRNSEEKIKQSLKEKEVLLKEVHHRVKNNLQVISSILNLQSSYVTDEQTIDVLQESQNRIKSMSFIHESLYQTKDFTGVNFADYIQNLYNNLLFSYSPKNKKIKIKKQLQNVHLNIDTAIPCGLIINELVSNALKHAFTNKKTGTVELKMKTIGSKKIQITIADNGKGFPPKFDYKNTSTLGLQLVMVLVGQIKATIKQINKNGVKFIITFNPNINQQ